MDRPDPCADGEHDLRRTIALWVEAPASLPFWKYNKKTLRSRHIKLLSLDTNRDFIWCRKCGWNQNTEEYERWKRKQEATDGSE